MRDKERAEFSVGRGIAGAARQALVQEELTTAVFVTGGYGRGEPPVGALPRFSSNSLAGWY